ncbi:hypothetical protein C3K47_06110 [Solitalea longa]|uniref:Uncharacterized protein n=1 Tax=Solitalea longa TaxID=2079460 RepID=A0A2S5A4W7_9SPHI|nr:hypothetical protein [Solitalea longa]POY37337.1 hypothetical protein C3K47_06110 [Solitalea longa]
MKHIISFCFFCAFAVTAFAQKETFDLITYTAPQNWTKDTRETVVSYVNINTKKKSWCRISIYKSTTSKGNIESDFESEWNTLVAKEYKVTEAPQTSEAVEAEGRKVKSGAGKFIFDNANATALITTISGFERCVSVVAVTNDQEYLSFVQSFMETLEMKAPAIKVQPVTTQQSTINDPSSVIGIWGKTATKNSSGDMDNGLHGYFKCQYMFNKNGTYSYISRVFSYQPEIILAKESGTYHVNGNVITLIPQSSIIQKWSKGYTTETGGRKVYLDKLGTLLSSQNRPLEKISYRFNKEYFSGIQEWNLALHADKETLRDGPFNGGNYYPNTWLYKAIVSDEFLVKTE